MGVGRLSINSVTRRRADGTEDALVFNEGVNVLVGEGNTGKTKWFQTIDYLLGDEVSAEERKDPENVLFTLFDSASASLNVNGEELLVERKWKEPGSLGKVYVNGESYHERDYCRILLQRLGMPVLHYPQGNPYGSRKWPELTLRVLFRHIYRRETTWSDIADAQPEVDQLASLLMFLGAAGQLFTEDYGDLVTKNKRLLELQTQKDQFMKMLDQVSKELVDTKSLGVSLTPESIEAAQDKLSNEAWEFEKQREILLRDIREGAEKELIQQKTVVPDIEGLSQRLVDAQGEMEKVRLAIRQADTRINELNTVRQLLQDETAKMLRAKEAGSILADLRVTHCPACDQQLEKSVDDHHCYVCGRVVVPEGGSSTAARRIDFESEQLRSELEETTQLLEELTEERNNKRELLRDLTEESVEIQGLLRPVRQAAASVLPPELFLMDVRYGRVQEKSQQLTRIRTVLDQREQLGADILKVQQEISELEFAVDGKANAVDFETLADRLRDGMGTYLNRISELNPQSWIGNSVSVRLSDRQVRFRVGDSGWKAKLGGTQKLYFFFAYHYALLNLTRYPDSLYPGFLMMDFPASLEDRKAIADKENFILEPFVELLRKEEMKGCQMLVAGRSFKGLENVNMLEFTEVWK